MPATVKTENQQPLNFKCLKCDEEFSDLYYLKVHSEIHNSDNEIDNKNYQSQSSKELNSGDVNTSECDETSEQIINNDVNEQTNGREIEIKLEITNLVTLKNQLDCVMNDSKSNDNEQIEEEADEDFKTRKQTESFEQGKAPEIVENSEQDSIVKNNEQLANNSDLKGQNLKSFNSDEAKSTVDQFETNENFNIEHSKTHEDDLMVRNNDEDENSLAKAMLLETDA